MNIKKDENRHSIDLKSYGTKEEKRKNKNNDPELLSHINK